MNLFRRPVLRILKQMRPTACTTVGITRHITQGWIERNQSLDTSIQSGNYNGKRTALASSKGRQIAIELGKCVNEINGSHTAGIDPLVIVLVPIVHIERVIILQSSVIKAVIDISRQVDRNAVDTDFQNDKTFSGTLGFSVIGTDTCTRHFQNGRIFPGSFRYTKNAVHTGCIVIVRERDMIYIHFIRTLFRQ